MKMDQWGPVYVTGGTGYLGHHLRQLLAEEDVSTTLLLRPGTETSLSSNESIRRGDLTDPNSLDFSGHEAVLHLAAQTDVEAAIDSPKETWEINATGTLHALEASREAGVNRFLYTSTSRVYGEPNHLPIAESHRTNPVDPYGASKLAGDRLVSSWNASYDMSTVVVRPFNSFGMHQPKSNVAAHIVDEIRSGGPVELRELSSERDFLYVPDVVTGILTALTKGEPGEVYNNGRGEAIPIGELAKLVVQVSEKDVTIVETGEQSREGGASIQKNFPDTQKLRSLGWAPRYSIQEGLREYLSR